MKLKLLHKELGALLLLLSSSLLLYALLMYVRSLQAYLEFGNIVFLDPIAPLFVSNSLPLNADQLRWLSYVLFLGISGVYGLLLYLLSKSQTSLSRAFFGWVILPYLVLGLAVLLLYPHISRPMDTADYAMHARVQWQFHQNPYAVAGGEFAAQTPLARFMEAKTRPSVYGPVWQVLTTPSLIGHDNILFNILLFKGMFFLMGLGCLGLVYVYRPSVTAVDPSKKVFAGAAVAWNPVLLLIAIGQGHNDIAMALCLAAALTALSFRRPLVGYASLTLSALVKFISLPLMLPMTVLIYRDSAFGSTIPHRRKMIFLGLFAGLTLAGMFMLPYGTSAMAGTISSRYTGLVETDSASKITVLVNILNRLILVLGVNLSSDLIARGIGLLLPILWLVVIVLRSKSVRSLNQLVKVSIESFLIYVTIVALPVHAQYAITPVVLLGFLYVGRWHLLTVVFLSLALLWDSMFLVYIPDNYPVWESLLHQISHGVGILALIFYLCLVVYQSVRKRVVTSV